MTKKYYPLIISDYDGTLLRSDCTVGEKTVLSITKYRKQGGIFVICTGRMLPSILPEAKKLSLTGWIASYQGSVISDIETGEIVRFVGFEKAAAYDVCLRLEEMGMRIHLYTIDALYVNYRDDQLDYYEKVCKVTGIRPEEKLSDWILRHDDKIIKIVAVVRKSENKKYLARVKEAMEDKYYVTSSAGMLIEITPLGHTKAAAVKFLSEQYQIDVADMIALGDNLNDLPMLQAVGLGVAVANGTEELKLLAKEVTLSNNEEGVAHIIEKYGTREGGQENE